MYKSGSITQGNYQVRLLDFYGRLREGLCRGDTSPNIGTTAPFLHGIGRAEAAKSYANKPALPNWGCPDIVSRHFGEPANRAD